VAPVIASGSSVTDEAGRRSLDRLRLRLSAWYLGTFCIILALLGGGLFFVIRSQLSRELDSAMRSAALELERAARIREKEAAFAQGAIVDAVDELRIPDRSLFLFTTSGVPVKPDSAEPWLRATAVRAGKAGSVDEEHELPDERTLRVHAERFALANGSPLVGAVVADKIELENRYAALIGAFGAAAAIALLLVAAGGSIMVRKSSAPVERTMAQMRRFMADAAHELRTPITILRSRAEIALQQPREGDAYVSALRGVESESIRLGRIVDDLLTLARADAGERPIEQERFLLEEVVLDAAAAAGVMAESKGVTLVVGDCDGCDVAGDPNLVRQLTMILLDNAIKFTPGGGEVRVRALEENGRSTLIVEDNGPGIPAEQLPNVYDRFYRGDPARGRSEGAGLGLSIARWIADAHKAELEISSTVGRGTRVEVRFPPAGKRRSAFFATG
jgi:signal transduction histidine kinase